MDEKPVSLLPPLNLNAEDFLLSIRKIFGVKKMQMGGIKKNQCKRRLMRAAMLCEKVCHSPPPPPSEFSLILSFQKLQVIS